MSGAKQPNEIDRFVGLQLRLARRSRKLTQEQLAEQLGITFQQVQKYEHGTNRISAGRLHQLAAVLERPIGYFYPDPDVIENDFSETDAAVEAHELRGQIIKALPQIESVDTLRAIALFTGQAAKSDPSQP